jgi:uncharacterized repeat protein (TIGR01451 family)
MPMCRTVFALLLLFVSIPFNLMAQPDLLIGSGSGLPGDTLQIPVNLTADGTVVGLQLDLQYDAGLLSPGSAVGGSALSGHSFATSIPSQGIYRVVIYSVASATLGSGTLVTVPFAIETTALPGSTNLTMASVLLGNGTAAAVSATSLGSGSVTIGPQQGAESDLSVTIEGAPATVMVGSQLTYTVIVASAGPNADPGVVATTTLPTEVTLDSVTPSQGSCQSGNPVICSLGNLDSGSSASITIVTTVTAEGLLSVSAIVSGDEVDPNPANDSATAENSATVSSVEAIPTLNEWGLLTLMMLLAVASLWFLREQQFKRDVNLKGEKR